MLARTLTSTGILLIGAIKEAFIDYNTRRVHSALGYLTPVEYAMKKMKD